MSIKKTLCVSINGVCSLLLFLILLTSKSYMYSSLFKFLILFLSILIFVGCIVLLRNQKSSWCKLLFALNIVFTIGIIVVHILKINNLLYMFRSVHNFKSFILSTGERGVLIYILLQTAQVIFLPVPASIIALAGALIYGPFWGSIYCIAGVLLGSYISFFLGRILGFKLVAWVVGYDNAIKYANILNDSGKIFLGIAFLLPMFPDDILCLISGITTMKFKYFFIITTIFRPIGAICMCYFGGGYVIPFSGWGIPLWVVIGIALMLLVIYVYKNQNKIEDWFVNKLRKADKK